MQVKQIYKYVELGKDLVKVPTHARVHWFYSLCSEMEA